MVAIIALLERSHGSTSAWTRLHQVAERPIDHPLAFDTALAREIRAFDPQAEVALASRIIAAVPAVLLAVVDQLDAAGKFSAEPSRLSISAATGPVVLDVMALI